VGKKGLPIVVNKEEIYMQTQTYRTEITVPENGVLTLDSLPF